MDSDKNTSSIRKHEIYPENPFMDQLGNELGSSSKNAISEVITKSTTVLDKATGEFRENEDLLVAKTKVVDTAAFTKIFHDTIKDKANLSEAASNILFWYIAPNLAKDSLQIMFDQEECELRTEYSRTTIYRAINEFLDSKILARSKWPMVFFINPKVLFNGNRIFVFQQYIKDPKITPQLPSHDE